MLENMKRIFARDGNHVQSGIPEEIWDIMQKIEAAKAVVAAKLDRKASFALPAYRGDPHAKAQLAALDEETASAARDLENLQLALKGAQAEIAGAKKAELNKRAIEAYILRKPMLAQQERQRREQILNMIENFKREKQPHQARIWEEQLDDPRQIIRDPVPEGYVEEEQAL